MEGEKTRKRERRDLEIAPTGVRFRCAQPTLQSAGLGWAGQDAPLQGLFARLILP